MRISDETMEQMREHYVNTIKECCLDMSNRYVRKKLTTIYKDGIFYLAMEGRRIGKAIRLKGIDNNGQKIITHEKPTLWRKQSQPLLK